MPQDGCFVHYLTQELNDILINFRINKVYLPSPLDIVLQLRGKNKEGKIVNYQLLISSRLDSPHINITNEKFQNPEIPNVFCMTLRKHIERGIISSITQYKNDRLIEIKIKNTNELDDEVSLSLIFEIMGRNSNVILIDNKFTIIDAIRKLPPNFDNLRTIIPHATYIYPSLDKAVNPFLLKENDNIKDAMGISKLLISQLDNLSNDQIKSYLNQEIKPVIFENNNKLDYYAYKLNDDNKVVKEFNLISEMLDEFYLTSYKETNFDASNIDKIIHKNLRKAINKLDNLNIDLEKAITNLKYNDEGVLLQTNLYQIKKGDKQIVVNNFLSNNEPYTIYLNPLLSPSENLKKIFQKAKKAKNGIDEIKKQISIINQEIDYLETILLQMSFSSNNDLKEIKEELENEGYIIAKKYSKQKHKKINLAKIVIDDIIIYIGKNNIQNEYLTHKIARNNDYWFHIKDAPGSHVVVSVPSNDPNFIMSENLIRAAANAAAFFSKGKTSSSVPVDYTKVKYIKKIPGQKGYHVTYTNQKTIYIDPKDDFNFSK